MKLPHYRPVDAAFSIAKHTLSEWSDDKCMKLAAALAYYTVFSIAPLLIIVAGIAGMMFGHEAAQGQISTQVRGLFGAQGAEAIQSMVANAGKDQATGVVATVVGIVTLLFGASGVFGELQDSLNTIWEVQPKPGQGFKAFLRTRFLSFSMILGIGFLLMTSLVVSAALAAVNKYMSSLMPGTAFIWMWVNFVVSLSVIITLFAMMFKILPDVDITWRDVWLGSTLTGILFSLGKYGIGLYLGQSSFGSIYGAAGSFVILLVWVYYSAQILFIGAEFTQVYAHRYGSRIRPTSNAEWVKTATIDSKGDAVQPINAT